MAKSVEHVMKIEANEIDNSAVEISLQNLNYTSSGAFIVVRARDGTNKLLFHDACHVCDSFMTHVRNHVQQTYSHPDSNNFLTPNQSQEQAQSNSHSQEYYSPPQSQSQSQSKHNVSLSQIQQESDTDFSTFGFEIIDTEREWCKK